MHITLVEPYNEEKVLWALPRHLSLFFGFAKAVKDKGYIAIDGITELHDVPDPAWAYKPGNRSAPERVLGQYK